MPTPLIPRQDTGKLLLVGVRLLLQLVAVFPSTSILIAVGLFPGSSFEMSKRTMSKHFNPRIFTRGLLKESSTVL